jgi:indole-3-glycerol phosphate synthase
VVLGASGMSLIAEVKRQSPSKGPIWPELNVEDLVRQYELAGAVAISVLTEEEHFRGSLADLDCAAGASSLPLLRKDFVIDEYQIVEAAAYGASAVLLIASLLSDRPMMSLSRLAFALGLDVLLEVHDEVELGRAACVETAIIGINNRDLRTFAVSLDVTESLIPKVPTGRVVVSESGISSRADVVRLEALGVDAILVGESLLRSGDVVSAVAELLRRKVTTEREAS